MAVCGGLQESSSSSATSSRQSFTKHFKPASRAFAGVEGSFSDAERKAASRMQNLKRWQRARTDWPGGFLPQTARSGRHAQGKKHLDQRGEQKTWDCANSNGPETAAPGVGEKDPKPGFHCALRELVLTERERPGRQGRWSVRR